MKLSKTGVSGIQPEKKSTFFPTSLCGVLVFRLDPAGAPPPPPPPPPPHSLAHSLAHSGAVRLPLAWQCSTQSLVEEPRRAWSPLGPRLPFAWQAQYTEPPGGAAARVVTAGAAAAFRVAGAVHRASGGAAAWSPLGPRLPFSWHLFTTLHYTTYHISLIIHHSSLHYLSPFRVAGAVYRALWRSCGARGRRWAAAGLRVASAVHRASWRSCGARGRRWGRGCLAPGRRSTQSVLHGGAVAQLPFAWQAQYTEPPGVPFSSQSLLEELRLSWEARYTEPCGGAAAHVVAAGAAAAFRVEGAVHRVCCGACGRRWGRGCLSRGRRSTQTLLEELRRAWSPLGPRLPFEWRAQHTSWRSCGARGRRWAAAGLRVAGAVHRASWRSCGARGRRWGRGCLSRGRRSTQSVLHGGAVAQLPFAWQAQYTEPPGVPFSSQSLLEELRLSWQARYTEPPEGAAARVVAAGAAAAFLVAGAVHRASSAAFRVAGAIHRASWRSCGARGRRWGRGCLSSGRRSTQSLLQKLRRAWSPLGPRLPFAWQAQYTEPPGGAAARVVAAGAAAAFRVAGAVHRASWRVAARVVAAGAVAAFRVAGAVHRRSTNSSQLHFSHLTHHSSTAHHNSSQLHFLQVHFSSQLITSQLITVPLLTPHFSHLTYHITTSHYNSSQLITSQLITAPLLKPLLTPHLSHQNSSQLHFSHLTSHTSPKFTLKP